MTQAEYIAQRDALSGTAATLARSLIRAQRHPWSNPNPSASAIPALESAKDGEQREAFQAAHELWVEQTSHAAAMDWLCRRRGIVQGGVTSSMIVAGLDDPASPASATAQKWFKEQAS